MRVLPEQHAAIEHDHTIDAVNSKHAEQMKELEAGHKAALEELRNQHASKMIDVALEAPCDLPTRECIVGTVHAHRAQLELLTVDAGALGPGPDRGFGVATQELLWSLGLPDTYTDKHNLHRKLETALRCLAAERPADPCSRLAQLMM